MIQKKKRGNISTLSIAHLTNEIVGISWKVYISVQNHGIVTCRVSQHLRTSRLFTRFTRFTRRRTGRLTGCRFLPSATTTRRCSRLGSGWGAIITTGCLAYLAYGGLFTFGSRALILPINLATLLPSARHDGYQRTWEMESRSARCLQLKVREKGRVREQ